MMGFLIHIPRIMTVNDRAWMTRNARQLQPDVEILYEQITPTLWAIKVDFNEYDNAVTFLNKYWQGVSHEYIRKTS